MQKQYKPYKHYKGGHYLVVGEALHTETEEEMVIYVSAVSGTMFCRPKSMFYGQVETESYTGDRFVPVSSD